MEFLSAEYNYETNHYPVNLVMQSLQSVIQGDNAAGTDTFVVANLTFDPTAGFHEYRIDFIPGKVIFYADSQVLTTMTNPDAIPTHSGKIYLTQWSNGNPGWSRGPPLQDTVFSVSYVKAYFDSLNATRNAITSKACKDPSAPNATCAIPDQLIAPNPDGPDGNVTGMTFFFSKQTNETPGQIIYKHNGAAGSPIKVWGTLVFAVLTGLLASML